MTEVFNTLLIHPIINLLVAIYKILIFLGLPFTLGISIILLTALFRFLLSPLTGAQLRSTQKMQELKPHLERIKEKHKNDRARQQSETMQLYRQHGVNPATGCLLILIQFPIFIALYNVLLRVVNQDTVSAVGEINKILYHPVLFLDKAWDPNFLGISLAAVPLNSWQAAPVLLLIPLASFLFQFVQSRMMALTGKISSGDKRDDFQKVMQTQMLYFLPLMIGFFSFTLPVGLSLYWNTFTLFGIIQQYRLGKENGKTGNS